MQGSILRNRPRVNARVTLLAGWGLALLLAAGAWLLWSGPLGGVFAALAIGVLGLLSYRIAQHSLLGLVQASGFGLALPCGVVAWLARDTPRAEGFWLVGLGAIVLAFVLLGLYTVMHWGEPSSRAHTRRSNRR